MKYGLKPDVIERTIGFSVLLACFTLLLARIVNLRAIYLARFA